MSAAADSHPKATAREWIGLAVLALPCLLYSMDLTVLNLAVPHLSAALQPSSAELLWIVDVYGFVLAGALIPMGTLGDRIGRRRVLMFGAAAFGLASLLAAFANSVALLIAARALLGLAAATLAPSTLSLIRNMFHDPKQRTVAIGVWVSSFSVGGAVGPVFGGLLLEHFWWGSVFLLNVPVMVMLLLVGPRLLPEFRDPGAGRPDVGSALLSLATVLAVIFGLKRMAEQGVGWLALAAVLLGLLIGAVFVRRQRRLAEPFVDLSLFRRTAFSTALAVNTFGCFVAFGTFLLIAQYLQLVLGLSPLQAGLWSAPSGLAFILGAVVTPYLLRGLQPATVVALGLLLASAGFAVLALTGAGREVAPVVAAFGIMSLGMAPVFTLTTDLIVGSVPAARAGTAAGMSETSAEFGGALGVAVLGSLATLLYRQSLEVRLPAGLDAAESEAALDTLAGALATAEALPESLSGAVAGAARLAFVGAFEVAAAVAATITLAASLGALFLLRRGGTGRDERPVPAAETA